MIYDRSETLKIESDCDLGYGASCRVIQYVGTRDRLRNEKMMRRPRNDGKSRTDDRDIFVGVRPQVVEPRRDVLER
jgi:hypothetical protein